MDETLRIPKPVGHMAIPSDDGWITQTAGFGFYEKKYRPLYKEPYPGDGGAGFTVPVYVEPPDAAKRIEELRNTIIQTVFALGGGATDSATDKFLSLVPEEARLVKEKLDTALRDLEQRTRERDLLKDQMAAMRRVLESTDPSTSSDPEPFVSTCNCKGTGVSKNCPVHFMLWCASKAKERKAAPAGDRMIGPPPEPMPEMPPLPDVPDQPSAVCIRTPGCVLHYGHTRPCYVGIKAGTKPSERDEEGWMIEVSGPRWLSADCHVFNFGGSDSGLRFYSKDQAWCMIHALRFHVPGLLPDGTHPTFHLWCPPPQQDKTSSAPDSDPSREVCDDEVVGIAQRLMDDRAWAVTHGEVRRLVRAYLHNKKFVDAVCSVKPWGQDEAVKDPDPSVLKPVEWVPGVGLMLRQPPAAEPLVRREALADLAGSYGHKQPTANSCETCALHFMSCGFYAALDGKPCPHHHALPAPAAEPVESDSGWGRGMGHVLDAATQIAAQHDERCMDVCVCHLCKAVRALKHIPKPAAVEHKCAARLGSTCVYLADGTKVVLRRGQECKGSAWLEVMPQAKLHPAAKPAAIVGGFVDGAPQAAASLADALHGNDPLVERVAQAIYHHGYGLTDEDCVPATGKAREPWADIPEHQRDEYRMMAWAAVAEMRTSSSSGKEGKV